MPTTVQLVGDGHVIHQIYVDPWNMNDLNSVFEESQKIYDAATFKVHLLTDVTKSRNIPAGILRARKNPSLSHPNAGSIVVAGAAPLLRRMGEVILGLSHYSRAKFVETTEEGLAYLEKLVAEEKKS